MQGVGGMRTFRLFIAKGTKMLRAGLSLGLRRSRPKLGCAGDGEALLGGARPESVSPSRKGLSWLRCEQQPTIRCTHRYEGPSCGAALRGAWLCLASSGLDVRLAQP